MGMSLSLLTPSTCESLSYDKAGEDIFLILNHLAWVGKRIAQDLKKAGLNQLTGATGAINVQGEQVQKLDERANQIFVEGFENQELVNGEALFYQAGRREGILCPVF